MFRENEVKKTYWAITKKIESNKIIRLENFLQKNEKQILKIIHFLKYY